MLFSKNATRGIGVRLGSAPSTGDTATPADRGRSVMFGFKNFSGLEASVASSGRRIGGVRACRGCSRWTHSASDYSNPPRLSVSGWNHERRSRQAILPSASGVVHLIMHSRRELPFSMSSAQGIFPFTAWEPSRTCGTGPNLSCREGVRRMRSCVVVLGLIGRRCLTS
jgi:hypothetical protein